jgi:hypothetical protein
LAKERNKKVKKQIGIISNKRGEFVENPLEKKTLNFEELSPPPTFEDGVESLGGRHPEDRLRSH